MSKQAEFRYIRFICGGPVVCYPQIRNDRGENLYNFRYPPGAAGNQYHRLDQVQNDVVVDINSIGISNGRRVMPGFDVVNGNDDWLNDSYNMVFKSDSDQMITVRKYGGQRDGDAAFDGSQKLPEGTQPVQSPTRI
ncbi:hypothetical protein E8E14_014737 [Neopestalotiopsis sp. 37M]|nr:hypothetical protein E8E14_014737 [Neopestalotiopsis sp. 37M]